jgi:hypothetical protein
MKVLSEKFYGKGTKSGWFFEQLKRDGNLAIYKKQSNSLIYYEVIIIKKSKDRKAIFRGVEVNYEAGEHYPKDNDFGYTGWVYNDFITAEKKFNVLKFHRNAFNV